MLTWMSGVREELKCDTESITVFIGMGWADSLKMRTASSVLTVQAAARLGKNTGAPVGQDERVWLGIER